MIRLKVFFQRNSGLVAVCVLLFFAAVRVQTYVSGQDPAIYMRHARILLAEPVGSPDFVKTVKQFAPGYPLLLASVIRVGGCFAPHWINLAFGMATLITYALLIRRMYRDPWVETIFLLTTSLLLLAGYNLNTHFLLYPFRAASGYFLVWLGFFCLFQDGPVKANPKRIGLASVIFLLAVLIREPLVLCSAAGAVWLGTQPRSATTWKNLAVFAVPFLVCGLFAAIALALFGVAGTDQLTNWIRNLSGIVGSGLFQHIGSMTVRLAAITLDELTWVGVILLSVGLWVARKDRHALCFFVMPAILFFVFYSFYLYPHRRYYMSILLFLCPVVSLGLVAVLDMIALRLRWARRNLYTITLIGLFSLLVLHVSKLEPWGPSVSREQVLRFYDNLEGLLTPNDAVVSDWPCRYLQDALLSYSTFPIVKPDQVEEVWEQGGSVYYFKPLNEEAFYALPRPIYHVSTEQMLRAHYTFRPTDRPSLSIAGGDFDVYEVLPWSDNPVRQPVNIPPDKGAVVWIDLRDKPDHTPVTLALTTERNRLEWSEVEGGGFHGLFLTKEQSQDGPWFLEIVSPSSLPSDPLYGVKMAGRPIDFDLLYDRSLSVQRWFQPPFPILRKPERERYAATLHDAGQLCLPSIVGDAREFDVMLTLSPSPIQEETALLTYTIEGSEIGRDEVSLSQARSYVGFHVPLQPGSPTPCVKVVVDPPHCFGSHLRIHRIRLTASEHPLLPKP